MSLTFTEARDEILTLFKTAWDTLPTPPVLQYWDVPGGPPDAADWARITVRHITGNNDGITSSRFENGGVVTVQIFTRFGQGLSSSDIFSKVAADAFRGKSTPGGVWFRNVRLNEVGVDGDWFQVNVTADFTYDEVI